MTKQELAQAIDEAYRKYAEAFYDGLHVSEEELDVLWQAYQNLVDQSR